MERERRSNSKASGPRTGILPDHQLSREAGRGGGGTEVDSGHVGYSGVSMETRRVGSWKYRTDGFSKIARGKDGHFELLNIR